MNFHGSYMAAYCQKIITSKATKRQQQQKRMYLLLCFYPDFNKILGVNPSNLKVFILVSRVFSILLLLFKTCQYPSLILHLLAKHLRQNTLPKMGTLLQHKTTVLIKT